MLKSDAAGYELSAAAHNIAGITDGGTHHLCVAGRNVYALRIACARGRDLATQIIMPKEWKFPSDADVDNSLVEAADGSEIVARLLMRRGLKDADSVRAFLNPDLYTPTAPSELKDMERAVARVKQAIANGEKVTVYGDYDVDGVTATAVMVTTLKKLGADVDFYIPTRSEGYGLNLKAVSVLASKHRTKLIITCDCGISNFSEINFARSLGVDTVVVDHHTMPELLPPAAAILHPKQLDEEHPLFHLPGVGVAYKLAEALLLDAGMESEVQPLLDFVTLGMIADMVPLTRECRYLVQVGMPQLVGSQRAGIRALLAQVSQKSDGTDLVGFGLAPRINAVGRLSDANLAVRLMITEDVEEARKLANQLELENVRRQELCEQIFEAADQVAGAKLKGGDRALAIFNTGWHHGVVGIVASRLVEKYHCPVFIGELDSEEAIVKGSARGIPGIDLYQVLKANEHLALKWGGHKMAAGFSVEAGKADLWCRGVVETCNRMLAETSMYPTLDIDLVVEPDDVSMELATELTKLAPFGMANKKPVLAVRGGECVGTRVLGKEGKHHRISVMFASGEDGPVEFECVYWNSKGRVPLEGQAMDIAFAPELNTFNGNTRLQLVLSDWRDPAKPIDFTPPVAQPSVAAPPVVVPDALPNVVESFAPPPPVVPINWKDLRNHATPESLVHAALRKLGGSISIFAEGAAKIANVEFHDRSTVPPSQHLLLWTLPPDRHVFKTLFTKTNAQHIYYVGGATINVDDAAGFVKKLLGIVRFAVNQRDGQAEAEKIAAALASTKMCVALGLNVLKKIEMIDWFAEDGTVFLDLVGQPTQKPEDLTEFKQLAQCLREVAEFRDWCHSAPLNEIQLALVPAKAAGEAPKAPQQTVEENFSGISHNDTANLSSPYTG